MLWENLFLKTGIHNELYPELEIYPNPVGSILKIKSIKMIRNILICNLSGRIITALIIPEVNSQLI